MFAEAAGCRPAWKQDLVGWNMVQSQQVLEWMAEGEVRGRAISVLRVLRLRFGALPADLDAAIRAETTVATLDHWLELAVNSPTLVDFRAGAQL